MDTVSISGNYRYVQMYGITRTTQYGYSIYEMDVYGVGGALGPDADYDGVGDSADQCPGTPANTPVGSDGCEIGFIGGYDAPTSYPGMTLVWADEFNGTSLNTANWTHEIGDGCPNLCGWGNNEQQYYRAENTAVANGWLTIEAKNESFGGRNYTSSRLKTQGKQSFQYGRIDFRAVLPQGLGPWPALWMLGDSISSEGWPEAGEIDVMEKIGGEENRILGTVHWDNNGSYASYGCGDTGGCPTLSSGTFADEFHVFSIVWDSNFIRWYLDDATTPFHTIDISSSALSEFRAPFFFLMNIAVGGSLGGTPNNAIFPQKMIIDYVRVYQ
ncbi:MAG: glycoside hydrolase family 16 protein [Gammaproteobacteria bacterium]|nr:glycoside hydrolase family 16 protein [Gammaproteobacteria bacterium]NND38965.1 glycoside hydrolase family 16 protein [Pseudomonadales bacterium]NNL11527.1 glycoside hydrolase family 16 protein [Pseudomonadales bacterium]NNM10971.1 glycoside hydrolase family 16 protein [Pseudomonadales bacterium]RZV60119.1 MAG: glycoside hydrolase family 16 protein [Pseudomonadales bacterium]